jgi:anti-anti-sigma regulatory factor
MTEATADDPTDESAWTPALTITVGTRWAVCSHHRHPIPVQLVRVCGVADLTTSALLAAMLAGALTAAARVGTRRVVVDTAAMTFCGARGLRVLLLTAVLAERLDVVYALTGLSPRLTRLAARQRPDTPIYPDRAAAVTAVGLGPPWLPVRASLPARRSS